jgi:hypothetical protein
MEIARQFTYTLQQNSLHRLHLREAAYWIPVEGKLKDICQNENYCSHTETGEK